MIGIFAPLFYTAEEASASTGLSASQKLQTEEENPLKLPDTIILKPGCKVICTSKITIMALGTSVDRDADCFVFNQINNSFDAEFINIKTWWIPDGETVYWGQKEYKLGKSFEITFQKLALKPKQQTESIYFGPKSKFDCIEFEDEEGIESEESKHGNYDLVMDVPFLLGKEDFIIKQGKIFPTDMTPCRLYKIECEKPDESKDDIKTKLKWFTMEENSFKSFLSESESYLMCTEQQLNDALTENKVGVTKVAEIEFEVTEESTVQRVKEKVDELKESLENLDIDD